MRTWAKPPTRAELRKSMIDESRKFIVVPVELSEDVVGSPGRNPITLRAMVDTGALATLVRLSAVRGRIPYRRLPAGLAKVVKGIDSLVGKLRVLGALHVLVRAEGGPELPMTIGIIDFSGIPHLKIIGADMILGIDYLSLSAAMVDVSMGVVRYRIESAPFYQTAGRRMVPMTGSGPLPPAQVFRGVPEDEPPT